MARTIDYTVAYSDGVQNVDLCKILFGGDGSCYITAPYHPLNRAIAARVTVNYAKTPEGFSLDEAEELAVIDDVDKRLKVSHHPDGFLQFSGQGIRSGLDEQGKPRRMGVFSWSLYEPTLGPSFSLMFSNAVACGRPSAYKKRTIVFHEEDVEHLRLREDADGLCIVGHHLPGRWREFAYRGADGEMWLDLLHPHAQAVKHLRLILASKDSDIPGLIGIEAVPHVLPQAKDGQPSFFVSTSTGSLHRNAEGDLLGDALYCAFPYRTSTTQPSPAWPTHCQPLPTPPRPAPRTCFLGRRE